MDRGCSVSINACLTLPRLSAAADAGRPSEVLPGIRFEYSWGPATSGQSPVSTGGGLRGWTTEKGRCYKNSSSGYGSGEHSSESISRNHYNAAGNSVVAATLTLSHPHQSNPQSPSHPQLHSPATTPSGRVIQPYERRCRSTCSITLQGLNNKSNNDSPNNGPNYPPLRSQLPQQQKQPNNPPSSLYLPLRRSSEGEANVTWNSHSKLPQLLASVTDSRCPVIGPTSTSPAALASSDSQKDAEVKKKYSFIKKTQILSWKYCTTLFSFLLLLVLRSA